MKFIILITILIIAALLVLAARILHRPMTDDEYNDLTNMSGPNAMKDKNMQLEKEIKETIADKDTMALRKTLTEIENKLETEKEINNKK
jgi:hypothetical protein